MTERVAFLIDGLNVYHSMKAALDSGLVQHAKWLNYVDFCQSLLRDVVFFRSDSVLSSVNYFTALATHIPDCSLVQRHRTLIEVLDSLGTKTVLGNFKKKKVTCKAQCGLRFVSCEEKETDVNIAISLLRLFLNDQCDTAVVMSDDTDLVPAISAAKEIYPNKRIGVAFPYKRSNSHFKKVADFTFKLSAERYQQYQLAEVCFGSDGRVLVKPPDW